ncbi:MAG: 2-isopropylmalate synthase [Clostridia bacterium]
MQRKIKIFDTTLRDGEQSPGCSMNLQEKLQIAKALEVLGVDIIEAGFAITSPGDFKAVEEVSKIITNAEVASLARATIEDIDAAFSAVKNATCPRIHTFLATSDIHMKYKLHMTKQEVLDRTYEMVKYAVGKCSNVEFSAEDACRSDKDFLVAVFTNAIKAGAKVINIPDTVGYNTPDEVYEYIKYIMNNVNGIEKVTVSTHNHNDLGLAVANSIAAVNAGATQVECCINGIGERAGNASLEEIVMALKVKEKYLDVTTNIDTKKIYRTCKLVSQITGVSINPTKPIVGANAFAHEAGIHQHGVMNERSTYEIMVPELIGVVQNDMVLGKHSGKHALKTRIEELGYTAPEDSLEDIFESFKKLADKKKVIKDADIISLVGSANINKNDKYILDKFVINSGNNITSTAILSVKTNDELIEKVALGDGPIDASFKAINMIVGDFTLIDYSIHAITDGHDAQGEAVVKLKYQNKGDIIIGRGVSTDIIEASIKAYLSAANKFVQ